MPTKRAPQYRWLIVTSTHAAPGARFATLECSLRWTSKVNSCQGHVLAKLVGNWVVGHMHWPQSGLNCEMLYFRRFIFCSSSCIIYIYRVSTIPAGVIGNGWKNHGTWSGGGESNLAFVLNAWQVLHRDPLRGLIFENSKEHSLGSTPKKTKIYVSMYWWVNILDRWYMIMFECFWKPALIPKRIKLLIFLDGQQ